MSIGGFKPPETAWRSDARKPVRILLNIYIFQATAAENVSPLRSKSLSLHFFYTSELEIPSAITITESGLWSFSCFETSPTRSKTVAIALRFELWWHYFTPLYTWTIVLATQLVKFFFFFFLRPSVIAVRVRPTRSTLTKSTSTPNRSTSHQINSH